MPHQDYFLKDGTQVPSVTTIIGNNLSWKAEGLYRWYYNCGKNGENPFEKKERAADTGTLCHARLQFGETGEKIKPCELERASMSDIVIAEQAWDQWCVLKKEMDIKVIGVEQAYVSEQYKFAGCIDYLIEVDGKTILLDAKTSAKLWPDHLIQLSAYRHLLHENGVRVDGCAFLKIDKIITAETKQIVHYTEVPEDMCENGVSIMDNCFDVFKSLLVPHSLKKYCKFPSKRKKKEK